MNIWSYALIGSLFMVVILLLIKINLLQKSAKEIKDALGHILKSETNSLIDISSRDKYLCELAESINIELRKLRSERQGYEQGNLQIKESITNISHDLRTPLTAICGYLDLLESEEKSEKAKEYIKIIENRTKVLTELTDELFKSSLINSIISKESYEDVVLNNVLAETISGYYIVLKERKINPEIYMPEGDIVSKLNRKALSRIFENIIGNAIKYSDGDLKIVLSEDGEITFSNYASKLNEIEVGKLFNRFYTVETRKKSTGLGLSIAKVLTEEMNGRIKAEYCDGKIKISLLFSERG